MATLREAAAIDHINNELLASSESKKFNGHGTLSDIQKVMEANLDSGDLKRGRCLNLVKDYLFERRRALGAHLLPDEYVMTQILKLCLVPWIKKSDKNKREALHFLGEAGLAQLGMQSHEWAVSERKTKATLQYEPNMRMPAQKAAEPPSGVTFAGSGHWSVLREYVNPLKLDFQGTKKGNVREEALRALTELMKDVLDGKVDRIELTVTGGKDE